MVPQKPDIDPSLITECDFQPVAQTQISEYTCNPIFTPKDEGTELGSVGFHVTEVLGHPFYQIWYTQYADNDSYTVRYAASDDGIDWVESSSNPVLTAQQGDWDQDALGAQEVFWDSAAQEYVMVYQGISFGADEYDYGTWGLGVARSADGAVWNKDASNPAIDFLNDLSDLRPCWPLTAYATPEGYRGYISASTVGSNAACQMYAISSDDRSSWEIATETPVLYSGFSYDRLGFIDAAVVPWFDEDTQEQVLYMFYVGFADQEVLGNYSQAVNTTLNLARSYDNGLSWEKDPDNPIPINQSTPGEISSVGASVVGSRMHLWVADSYEGESGIGYFYYQPNITQHAEEQ